MRVADQIDDGDAEPTGEVPVAPLEERHVGGLAVDVDFLASVFINLRLCRQRSPGGAVRDQDRDVEDLQPDRQLD
jgi:hypothetical protein